MKLSMFTDNTLKVLMYVVAHPEHRCTRTEIAEYFSLSVEHLRKVIHQLHLWGYLKTFPGRNGGIELARSAQDINLGDLVRKTEKQMTMYDCQGHNCRLLPSCSLNRVLARAQEAFLHELGKHSLDSLVTSKGTYDLLVQ